MRLLVSYKRSRKSLTRPFSIPRLTPFSTSFVAHQNNLENSRGDAPFVKRCISHKAEQALRLPIKRIILHVKAIRYLILQYLSMSKTKSTINIVKEIKLNRLCSETAGVDLLRVLMSVPPRVHQGISLA